MTNRQAIDSRPTKSLVSRGESPGELNISINKTNVPFEFDSFSLGAARLHCFRKPSVQLRDSCEQ